MVEQRRFVGQQPVQAAIQGIGLRQGFVFAEQVGHGAAFIPLPVQPPFAARIDQTIHPQGLQHMQPVGAFARAAQPGSPECVEFQIVPQPQAKPAGAPLPGFLQTHAVELDMHHGAGQWGWPRAIGGGVLFRKDRHLPHLRLSVFEHGNAFAPRRAL